MLFLSRSSRHSRDGLDIETDSRHTSIHVETGSTSKRTHVTLPFEHVRIQRWNVVTRSRATRRSARFLYPRFRRTSTTRLESPFQIGDQRPLHVREHLADPFRFGAVGPGDAGQSALEMAKSVSLSQTRRTPFCLGEARFFLVLAIRAAREVPCNVASGYDLRARFPSRSAPHVSWPSRLRAARHSPSELSAPLPAPNFLIAQTMPTAVFAVKDMSQ